MTPSEFRAAIAPLVAAAHRLKSPDPIARVVARVEKKVASCQSNANTRAKKAGIEGRLTLDDVRQAFLLDYGRECPFTGERMRYANTELDHVAPFRIGGENAGHNVRLLSARANKIKEGMTDSAAHILFDALMQMDAESAASATRRLAVAPAWKRWTPKG